MIEASKDVLGVPRLVEFDGAVREAFHSHAEVDIVVVRDGENRNIAVDGLAEDGLQFFHEGSVKLLRFVSGSAVVDMDVEADEIATTGLHCDDEKAGVGDSAIEVELLDEDVSELTVPRAACLFETIECLE